MRAQAIKPILLVYAVASAVAFPSRAAEVPASGAFSFMQCGVASVECTAVEGEYSIYWAHSIGAVQTEPGGGLFDLMTMQCAFSRIWHEGINEENLGESISFCDVKDGKGNNLVLSLVGSSATNPSDLKILYGTGKFAGMSGAGSSTPVGRFSGYPLGADAATMPYCNEVSGRYQLDASDD